MEKGYYSTGIKKLRNLYSQKLQAVISSLDTYGKDKINAVNTKSGINLIIRVRSKKNAEELCRIARNIGIQMALVADISDQETSALIFYFNRIPTKDINSKIKTLISLWEL